MRFSRATLLLAALAAGSAPSTAQTFSFSHLAGAPGGPGYLDGSGSAAQFHHPGQLARDGAGNIYVADEQNHTIRKITPAGVVTTVAGKPGVKGFADGTVSDSRFNAPRGVAVDGTGNLFVGDTGNYTVRRITPNGAVTTYAGTAGRSGNDSGSAENASFQGPVNVAVDAVGNVYVVDFGNSYGGNYRKIDRNRNVSTLGNPFLKGFSPGLAGIAAKDDGTLYAADEHNSEINKIAPSGVLTTIAGSGQFGNADGSGVNASFYYPAGISIDPNGDLFVADTGNSSVRKVTLAGLVSTVAGPSYADAPELIGSNDGQGADSFFNSPTGITVANGAVYISDTGNNVIRKLQLGSVTSFAGLAGQIGDGQGPLPEIRFNEPSGIAADASGNVYVADTKNLTLRVIRPDGAVKTIAGFPGREGGADGKGAVARFFYTQNIATDSAGNVYVADRRGNAIRKVTPGGVVSTFAGLVAIKGGSTDGAGTVARFALPSGIDVDSAGNVYVADTNNSTIRKITPSGNVTTLAGLARSTGYDDGIGSAARFSSPTAVVVNRAGVIYVSDASRLRKITPDGVVTTLVTDLPLGTCQGMARDSGDNLVVVLGHAIFRLGPDGKATLIGGGLEGYTDGPAASARFRYPSAVTVGLGGALYVADTGNNCVRKITPDGVVSTVTDGLVVRVDGIGPAAVFYRPSGLAVDESGNVYVADTDNHIVRKVSPSGAATTFAGQAGRKGYANGNASEARFCFPTDVVIDLSGNIVVTDSGNGAIRRIDRSGEVTTLAGPKAGEGGPGYADGKGSSAAFHLPLGIAMDSSGVIYVADRNNYVIRKILSDGTVSTFAGKASESGTADGSGSAARFAAPQGIEADRNGNLYVVDGYRIRKITPGGVVTTLAGNLNSNLVEPRHADGLGEAATFDDPIAIAIDPAGNLYVTESGNHDIRKITPAGFVTTIAGLPRQSGATDGVGQEVRFSAPAGIAFDRQGSMYVSDTGNHAIRKGSQVSAPAAAEARLVNLSVRSRSGANDKTLIVGLVVAGGGSKRVLIRGVGPLLQKYGVADALADPGLKLFQGSTQIDGNDDWDGSEAMNQTFATLGASSLTSGSKDAALSRNMTPGVYSVHVEPTSGASGVALAEIYDADKAGARFVNLSARTEVLLGDGVLVAGFVIEGAGSKTLLIRALGPTLGDFGVVGALQDPVVKLYNAQGALLSSNDDWGGGAAFQNAFASAGAAAFTAPTSKDSALLVSLTAGVYSVQVSGAVNTTGIALVEIYELQ